MQRSTKVFAKKSFTKGSKSFNGDNITSTVFGADDIGGQLFGVDEFGGIDHFRNITPPDIGH